MQKRDRGPFISKLANADQSPTANQWQSPIISDSSPIDYSFGCIVCCVLMSSAEVNHSIQNTDFSNGQFNDNVEHRSGGLINAEY